MSSGIVEGHEGDAYVGLTEARGEELWRHMEKKMANSNQSASNNIIVMTRTRPFNKRETDLKTFNCLEVRAEEESNRKLRLLRSELLH
jgi:hypothetical protein